MFGGWLLTRERGVRDCHVISEAITGVRIAAPTWLHPGLRDRPRSHLHEWPPPPYHGFSLLERATEIGQICLDGSRCAKSWRVEYFCCLLYGVWHYLFMKNINLKVFLVSIKKVRGELIVKNSTTIKNNVFKKILISWSVWLFWIILKMLYCANGSFQK